MRSFILVLFCPALCSPAHAQLSTTLPPVVQPPVAAALATPEPPRVLATRTDCPAAMPVTLAPLPLPKGCPAPGDGYLLAGSPEAVAKQVSDEASKLAPAYTWLIAGATGALVQFAKCDESLGELQDGGECSVEWRWGSAGVVLGLGGLLALLGG